MAALTPGMIVEQRYHMDLPKAHPYQHLELQFSTVFSCL